MDLKINIDRIYDLFLVAHGGKPPAGNDERWKVFLDVAKGIIAGAQRDAIDVIRDATQAPPIPLEHMKDEFKAGYEAGKKQVSSAMTKYSEATWKAENKTSTLLDEIRKGKSL